MVIKDASLAAVLQALEPAERAAIERLGAVPAPTALTSAQRAALRKIRARLKWRARAGKTRRGKR